MTAAPPPTPSASVDRRVLLAERDVARIERRVQAAMAETALVRLELADAHAATARERQRADALADELRKLYASSSWRWSAPVRAASFTLQRMRAVLGGPPPQPPAAPAAPATAPPPAAPALTLQEAAILARLTRADPA